MTVIAHVYHSHFNSTFVYDILMQFYMSLELKQLVKLSDNLYADIFLKRKGPKNK